MDISGISQNVRVRDVMSTNVLKMSKDSSVKEAMEKMSQRSYSSVVIAGETLEGILTERDLLVRVFNKDLDSTTKLHEVMTREVVTISPSEPVRRAASLMAERNIKKLVVMDKGEIVGIVTQTDIIKSLNDVYRTYRALLWNPWLSIALFIFVSFIILWIYLT